MTIERIVAEARQLQKQMSCFPRLINKPLLPVYFYSTVTIKPQERCADVELIPVRPENLEVVDLMDYWSQVCGLLENESAHSGKKAKLLFEFNRTLAVYYLRSMQEAGNAAQNSVYNTVKQLLTRLVEGTDKSPCTIILRPDLASLLSLSNVINDERVTPENREALENRIFLDKAEIEKLYAYTRTHAFGESAPYRTVLRDLRINS